MIWFDFSNGRIARRLRWWSANSANNLLCVRARWCERPNKRSPYNQQNRYLWLNRMWVMCECNELDRQLKFAVIISCNPKLPKWQSQISKCHAEQAKGRKKTARRCQIWYENWTWIAFSQFDTGNVTAMKKTVHLFGSQWLMYFAVMITGYLFLDQMLFLSGKQLRFQLAELGRRTDVFFHW